VLWVIASAAACGARPVASGSPPAKSPGSEAPSSGVVAIPEPPAEEVEPQPEEPPARAPEAGGFAGEWLEDWPNRGTCSDRIEVRVSGREVSVSGGDCTDGVAYEYSEARVENGSLKFTLRVPETNRILNYVLEPIEGGQLRGEVNGGAEATVTWRRPER
jgi:hypothetical protein